MTFLSTVSLGKNRNCKKNRRCYQNNNNNKKGKKTLMVLQVPLSQSRENVKEKMNRLALAF